MSQTLTLQTDGGHLRQRSAVSRLTSATFDLDRQTGGPLTGLHHERKLGIIGIDANLAHGLVELSVEGAFSEDRWRPPVEDHLSRPFQLRRGGMAYAAHGQLNLVDDGQSLLSIGARHSGASRDFRTVVLPGVPPILNAGRNNSSVTVRGRRNGADVRAVVGQSESEFGERNQRRLSFGYGGVSVRYRENSSALTFVSVAGGDPETRMSGSRSIGLDFIAMELFPEQAFETGGWSVLLPDTLSLDFADRSFSSNRGAGTKRSLSLTGTWTTPFGDTTLAWERERPIGTASGSHPALVRESSIFIDQAARVAGWNLSGNLFLVASDAGAAGETQETAFWGVEAGRALSDGTRLKLRIGRDRFRFDTLGGDFQLHDRSTRLRFSADLSQWLKRRLDRNDVGLELEARFAVGETAFDYRFAGEILFDERRVRPGHGVLLAFTMGPY